VSLSFFPLLNASLNALAGFFLFLGWRAIRAGRREVHRLYMVSAFATSILFLCSYITYHYLKRGLVTRYEGEGFSRIFYFFVLGTHTPLAVVIVPFCIAALWYAWKKNFSSRVGSFRCGCMSPLQGFSFI
jgi:putative membrane protein